MVFPVYINRGYFIATPTHDYFAYTDYGSGKYFYIFMRELYRVAMPAFNKQEQKLFYPGKYQVLEANVIHTIFLCQIKGYPP